MACDDLFRRSFAAGTEFFGMTRERAEVVVKELVKQGDPHKRKAQRAVDEVLDRSRLATDQLRQLIGRELGEQIAALGVATKDDIRALGRRIEALAAARGGSTGQPDGGPPPAAEG